VLSRWIPVLAATLVARSVLAAPADALDALDVHVVGALPFSRDELVAALRARLGPDAGTTVAVAMTVTVTATADGAIIASGGRERSVSLGHSDGPAAARLVALEAIDLLATDAATSLPPVAAPPASPAAPAHVVVASREPDVDTIVELAPARPADRSGTMLLGTAALWGSTGGAIAGGSIDMTPFAILDVPISVEIGGGQLVGGSLRQLDAATFRVSAGVRLSALELRGGVTIMPIVVGDGGGDFTALVGANASARVHIPLDRAMSLVLAAGLDVYADETRYTQYPMATVTTPWLAPWFAGGLEIRP
jgi:hypothetical protein